MLYTEIKRAVFDGGRVIYTMGVDDDDCGRIASSRWGSKNAARRESKMVYGRTSLYVGGVESKRVKKAGLRGGRGKTQKDTNI